MIDEDRKTRSAQPRVVADRPPRGAYVGIAGSRFRVGESKTHEKPGRGVSLISSPTEGTCAGAAPLPYYPDTRRRERSL